MRERPHSWVPGQERRPAVGARSSSVLQGVWQVCITEDVYPCLWYIPSPFMFPMADVTFYSISDCLRRRFGVPCFRKQKERDRNLQLHYLQEVFWLSEFTKMISVCVCVFNETHICGIYDVRGFQIDNLSERIKSFSLYTLAIPLVY